MKAITAVIKLTMILLSTCSVKDAGSARMSLLQSYYFFDMDNYTMWATLMIEDIEILTIYNKTHQIVFKQSWSMGSMPEFDWLFYNMSMAKYFDEILTYRKMIIKEVEVPLPATLQFQFAVVAYVDDPETYYYKMGINGEDTVYLNMTEHVWVAEHSIYSQNLKKLLNEVVPHHLYSDYINIAKKMVRVFAVAGKEAISKKIKPEVYFIKKSSNPEAELVCLATGFYPRSSNITLWKDKENIMDNVLVSETLPNGDGTYQKRALVTTGWEEQSTVYCKVEHISLEEPLVRQISMKHNTVAWIVLGSILAVVICMTALILIVKKRFRSNTSIAGRTMDRLLWRTTDRSVSMQR